MLPPTALAPVTSLLFEETLRLQHANASQEANLTARETALYRLWTGPQMRARGPKRFGNCFPPPTPEIQISNETFRELHILKLRNQPRKKLEMMLREGSNTYYFCNSSKLLKNLIFGKVQIQLLRIPCLRIHLEIATTKNDGVCIF